MRKYRSKEEWKELITKQKESDKSVSEFCNGKGIHPNLFYKRRRDYESGSFVQLPMSIKRTYSKIKIRIQDIIIEPETGYDAKELFKIVTTVLEILNVNIQLRYSNIS